MSTLIRTRINQNLLTVKRESKNVKSLLSLANQLAKSPNNQKQYIEDNIKYILRHTKRHDLLHIALLLATSRNTQAQQQLLPFIRKRLGKMHEADFEHITIYLSNKPYSISTPINLWLCTNIDGYSTLFDKYYQRYYAR